MKKLLRNWRFCCLDCNSTDQTTLKLDSCSTPLNWSSFEKTKILAYIPRWPRDLGIYALGFHVIFKVFVWRWELLVTCMLQGFAPSRVFDTLFKIKKVLRVNMLQNQFTSIKYCCSVRHELGLPCIEKIQEVEESNWIGAMCGHIMSKFLL